MDDICKWPLWEQKLREKSFYRLTTIVDKTDEELLVNLQIRALQCTMIREQHPPPLPLINVAVLLKKRLGHQPAFIETLSQGEGGVKLWYFPGSVFFNKFCARLYSNKFPDMLCLKTSHTLIHM